MVMCVYSFGVDATIASNARKETTTAILCCSGFCSLLGGSLYKCKVERAGGGEGRWMGS